MSPDPSSEEAPPHSDPSGVTPLVDSLAVDAGRHHEGADVETDSPRAEQRWAARREPPIVGTVAHNFQTLLDEKNPFRMPTVRIDAGGISAGYLAGASLAGLSHLHRATTGQDAFGWMSCEAQADRRSLSLVVADGLGSQPGTSQLGADVAVEDLRLRLCQAEPVDAWPKDGRFQQELFAATSQRMKQTRERIYAEFQDRHLSCVAAAVRLDLYEDRLVVGAGRVGDCQVFTLRNDQFNPLFPWGEGFVNVVDACLPFGEDPPTVEPITAECSPDTAIVLATDGLALDIYGSPQVRDWLAGSWRHPCAAPDFYHSMLYRRQGSQDDRTALVFWPPTIASRHETTLDDQRAEAVNPPTW